MRFLCYTLGDPSVPVPEPTPEIYARMGKFMTEASQAGVVVATGAVTPFEQATKIQYSGGNFTVVDGPYTEAKELIGGWALLEVRDKDEAVEWTKRFLAAAGGGESTVREVYGG